MKISLLLSLATATLSLNYSLANDILVSNQTGKNLAIYATTSLGTTLVPEAIVAHNDQTILSSEGTISMIVVFNEDELTAGHPEKQEAPFEAPSDRVLIANATDQDLFVIGANCKHAAKNIFGTIGELLPAKETETIKAVELKDKDGIDIIILGLPEAEAEQAQEVEQV